MHNKKYTLLRNFVLLTILSFITSGCLDYYQETKLKTDGSGSMFIHYWMKVRNAQDSLATKQLGIFEKDSIRAEFSSPYSTIEEEIEVYSDTTDTTVHAKVEISFQSIDSLNHMKVFREANFSLKDGAENQKIFSQFVPPLATGFGVKSEDFTVSYVYYLPGEVITHNGHELKENRLRWTYRLSEIGTGKTLTATFRPFKLKETPVWIYALSLFVLVVVIVFLFKKNRS